MNAARSHSPDPILIRHQQEQTLEALSQGKIEVPSHLFKDYQGAGVVENPDGRYSSSNSYG